MEHSDPIVEEARAAGKAYIDSFKGNRQALLEDLQRREKASGRPIVYLKPRLAPARPAVSAHLR